MHLVLPAAARRLSCDKTFAGRRDEGIIQVFQDTGIRRGELLGVRLEHLDLKDGRLTVTGKGGRTRDVAIGDQTVRALDRYLRSRTKHRSASSPEL